MQCTNLDERHFEEVGPDHVEQGVALLVDGHVDALAGMDLDPIELVVEELQAAPVVEGVQVVAGIGQDSQSGLIAKPCRWIRAIHRSPELEALDQRLTHLPEVELRRLARVDTRIRFGLDVEARARPGLCCRSNVMRGRSANGHRVVGDE
jgi:hypothetical protein